MLFEIALVAATLLCSLVSGFLLGFVIVAMPGIGTLDDRGFVRAFQVMDRVIQDRQPVFMMMWLGSVVALVAAFALGLGELDGGRLALLIGATAGYLLGLQLPTAVVNIPMNNAIQAVDLRAADDAEVRAARERFEDRWNSWNVARTVAGCLSSLGLLLLLLWQ